MIKNQIKRKITILQDEIRATNENAIQYLLGEITEYEFAPIREQRKVWQAEIKELEKQLNDYKGA